jgi:ArsR family transcriptional regulator
MRQWTAHPTEALHESNPAPESAPEATHHDEHLAQLKDVAASFKLLADETRLRVLSLLLQRGEMNVRTLCEQLDQSQPAVSHHLALLREAGLIRARRDGKHNFYRCIPEKMESFIDSTWRDAIVPDQDGAPLPLVRSSCQDYSGG